MCLHSTWNDFSIAICMLLLTLLQRQRQHQCHQHHQQQRHKQQLHYHQRHPRRRAVALNNNSSMPFRKSEAVKRSKAMMLFSHSLSLNYFNVLEPHSTKCNTSEGKATEKASHCSTATLCGTYVISNYARWSAYFKAPGKILSKCCIWFRAASVAMLHTNVLCFQVQSKYKHAAGGKKLLMRFRKIQIKQRRTKSLWKSVCGLHENCAKFRDFLALWNC